jgi:uncharacterized protein
MYDKTGSELETTIINKSLDFARDRMKSLHASHGWDHVQRVIRNAEHIAATELQADAFIVRTAAILHDIARDEQDRAGGTLCHAELGSAEAEKFLLSEGLDPDRARHIARCILSHRYRKERKPESIEAMILYDADKLDSIGAIGIGRAFLFAGEVGARLHNSEVDISRTASYSEEDTAYREFMVKLRTVKDKMLTDEGRRLAQERHDFMIDYFRRLDEEVKGEL